MFSSMAEMFVSLPLGWQVVFICIIALVGVPVALYRSITEGAKWEPWFHLALGVLCATLMWKMTGSVIYAIAFFAVILIVTGAIFFLTRKQ